MRFLRSSPSLKVIVPWKGLTSPERDGSTAQETDTSPKRPLFLTMGYTAADYTQRVFIQMFLSLISKPPCMYPEGKRCQNIH